MYDFWFSPNGRIGRAAFWRSLILHSLIIGVVSHNLLAIGQQLHPDILALNLLILAAESWPTFCVISKRLHDRDKSAWYYLLTFVPLANFWLIFIECGMRAGSIGPNRFGPPPGQTRGQIDKARAPLAALPAAPPSQIAGMDPRIARVIAAKAEADARNRRARR